MNNISIRNIDPQNITINGGGSVIGIDTVYVNGIDVTVGSIAYVVVPTKLSELQNDKGFITSEKDPTVPYFIKQITISDINSWNNKQDQLVSGVNIKTINDNSILGSGDIDISTSYSAGTGININNENVISNTITSYNDLTDLPIIPTKTSDLTNDSNFVSSDSLSEVAFSGSFLDLSNVPTIPEYTSDLENDGADGINPFITNQTDSLVNYYDKNFFWNILPKVNGTGTSITLDNTIEAKMKSKLSPSEMTQEDTPTPSSPQNIHTITGDNVITICGKNWLNRNTCEENKALTYASGTTFNETNSLATDYIRINVGETLYCTYKCQKMFYDKNKTYIGCLQADGTISTDANDNIQYYFTIPNVSNIYYVRLGYRTSYNTGVNLLTSNIMLNKGTTALPYEPYTLDTYPLTLGTLEYSKIGNYEDEFIYNTTDTNLELNKWYLKKNIDKVVLDGSEDWNKLQTLTNTITFQTTLNIGAKLNIASNKYYLFNNFVADNDYSLDSEHSYINNNGYVVIFINASRLNGNTSNDFKTWLSTHNTIVYYVLATPEYTLCNDTLQTQLTNIYNNMISKKGQTNISQVNDDLPMVITASALLDLNSLIGG